MKAAVIGSLNIDKVCTVDHIPKAGETLTASEYMETYGGKGANQAVALARLGAQVSMFGCVGKDEDGDRIIQHMKNEGVAVDRVKRTGEAPTGCAFINIGNGDNAIVIVPGANAEVLVTYLQQHRQALEEMDVLLLQNEIPAEAVTYILQNYGGREHIILYNPAPYRDIALNDIQMATWITPNASEAALLFAKGDQSVIENKCLMTRGSSGVSCYIEGELTKVPAIEAKVVDTTGAGDTFNGALAFGLGRGMSVLEAVTFANTAAGISTEKKGAQQGMPTYDDVLARMKRGGQRP